MDNDSSIRETPLAGHGNLARKILRKTWRTTPLCFFGLYRRETIDHLKMCNNHVKRSKFFSYLLFFLWYK